MKIFIQIHFPQKSIESEKKHRSKKKKFCFKELIFQNEVQLVNSFKAYISHKTEREETDERQKWMETLLQILMVSIAAAIFRQGI